jgi:hypothetical protein
MLRLKKSILWAGLLLGGAQATFGFSLLGPFNEAYQVPTIGYNLGGDVGAPKNLAEGYRRNNAVLYYAADASFWNYFGSNGMAAIDSAFAVYNNLNKVSSYSSDLSEFPFGTARSNWRAEALTMIDIKSVTMQLIIEQLGLAEPVRYVWTLHNRVLLPGTTCPFGETYLVIKRNFDPVVGTSPSQLRPTSYVNGTLYSYEIEEFCTGPNPLALALPFPVDTLAESSTAVAEFFGFGSAFTVFGVDPFGLFFTGLTRDDVGGLRYLYRTNNVAWESSGPDSLLRYTNNVPQVLVTSNLALFTALAATNNPATLQALYPNLVIVNSSNYFANVYTTNFSAYFTNYPWDPVGTPAHVGFRTNVTSSVGNLFQYTFGNLFTLTPTVGGGWVSHPLVTTPVASGLATVTIETTTIGSTNNPWGPYTGTNVVVTNITDVTFLTNSIVGDFVVLPTNFCEFAILYPQLTNVTTITNDITSAVNQLISTNVTGSTLAITQSLISYFTNHYFIIDGITCQTNSELFQGIEKVSFVRRDFDSLIGRFWSPITNEYVMHAVTNSQIQTRRASRVVTRPDILINAADLAVGPGVFPDLVPAVLRTVPNWNTANANPGLAGPGTIETGVGVPQTQFTYNNVGPIFDNFGLIDTNAFLTELSQVSRFIWGSFDGTTNEPVIYPNDVSIQGLENQMLVQITPAYLPEGGVGVPYLAHMETQGATPNWQGPFYWTLAPSSPGLPPGLFIGTDGFNSGFISGTPQQDGLFDFTIRVGDSLGHTIDRAWAIKISP